MRLSVDESGTLAMAQDSGEPEELDVDVSSRHLRGLEERIRLMKLVAAENEIAVQLTVASEASHQRVIDVMNCLAGERLVNLSFTDQANK